MILTITIPNDVLIKIHDEDNASAIAKGEPPFHTDVFKEGLHQVILASLDEWEHGSTIADAARITITDWPPEVPLTLASPNHDAKTRDT